MEKNYLITFKNTHDAIKGESIANSKKAKVRVMPTPTKITKSCGISLQMNHENMLILKEEIKRGTMNINTVYLMINEEYTTIDIDNI
ncbi:DUF3343 domain-containing protein [Oceanirhabdus sp. W0125-5]|uniref:DUF3343 domain-containing protein n=1 Tax=Oceanirhabdus sp. W0125-5 TaxID=2999116 RepID=UPI0022F2B3C8|nr:DUF3343 domain-containing protein [Oceanirhabdus sp. W0125-5]WBW97619.1 DUF3343 domain-containing protein [Oceanirhabdus sp. W0125-5]